MFAALNQICYTPFTHKGINISDAEACLVIILNKLFERFTNLRGLVKPNNMFSVFKDIVLSGISNFIVDFVEGFQIFVFHGKLQTVKYHQKHPSYALIMVVNIIN